MPGLVQHPGSPAQLMEAKMKRERVWYIVMNSNRARILRQLPGSHERAGAEITLQGPRRNLRAILNDRPARSFTSSGTGRRSAVEPGSDPLRHDKIDFLHEVFDYLTEQKAAGAFDRIVLIASPEILGLWRDKAPHDLQDVVSREVPKNLVRFPYSEIGEAVRHALAQ